MMSEDDIEEKIQEYLNDGVTVVENLFDEKEVEQIRNDFHHQLLGMGINHEEIIKKTAEPPNDVRVKGKPSRIFYNKWKIDACTNQKVYNVVKRIFEHTYFSGKTPGFEHIYGKSDDIILYMDRVCYRYPDSIKAEGGLGLHLDRNPYDPYLLKSNGEKKLFRPIQAFITLTDHYGSDTGGLRVVKGFHKKIDSYFKDPTESVSTKGEFFRLNSKSHTKLEKECQPINAKKGSLVLWDNRLPHDTCKKLSGYDTREVIYVGFLPNIALNQKYVITQLEHIKKNIPPPAYYEKDEVSDRNWNDTDLTEFQKKLLGYYLYHIYFLS